MSLKNFLKLITVLAVSELAGIVGALFTTPAIPYWYNELVKPSFSPPSWVFGPVWTMLYLLMGLAAYLIWVHPGISEILRRRALAVFVLQLLLNIAWSVLFFGMQNPAGGFIEILLLFTAILGTIVEFNKISRTAALLLVPYAAWVAFASVLNYFIWQLN